MELNRGSLQSPQCIQQDKLAPHATINAESVLYRGSVPESQIVIKLKACGGKAFEDLTVTSPNRGGSKLQL